MERETESGPRSLFDESSVLVRDGKTEGFQDTSSGAGHGIGRSTLVICTRGPGSPQRAAWPKLFGNRPQRRAQQMELSTTNKIRFGLIELQRLFDSVRPLRLKGNLEGYPDS